MNTFSYNFNVKAETKPEADKLVNALTQIYKNFSKEELITFGEKLSRDPGKIRRIINNPLLKSMW